MRRTLARRFLPLSLALTLASGCEDSGTENDSGVATDSSVLDGSGVIPNTCPAGQELPALKGKVTAPNGLDPITGALVYVARGPVPPLPQGNDCDLCKIKTSGVWVQTTTATSGTFSFKKVPAGDIQVVIQLGHFRRVVSLKAPCATTVELTAEQGRLPRNPTEGDIPRVAVATGNVDFMQYVLKKLGLEIFDLFEGRQTGPNPPISGLLTDAGKLSGYHVLLINCSNADHDRTLLESGPTLKNLQDFVHAGGRLFVDDLSYEFVEWPFPIGIDFEPDPSGAKLASTSPQAPIGSAEVGLPGGDPAMPAVVSATCPKPDLLDWLKQFPNTVNADSTVPIEGWLPHWAVMHATPGATQVWVTGKVAVYGGPAGERPLSASVDPEGLDGRRCGRVVFNSYHTVPNKASASDPFTPQERILEYLFFKVAGCRSLE